MTRLLLITLVSFLLATAMNVAASDGALCPRSVDSVLASAVCGGHRVPLGRIITHTLVASDTADDVCITALRSALDETPHSLPCISTTARAVDHMRRLDEHTPPPPKYNCTLDASAPLNVSNLTQPFRMQCKHANKPSDNTVGYVLCGFFGGIFVGCLIPCLICNSQWW